MDKFDLCTSCKCLGWPSILPSPRSSGTTQALCQSSGITQRLLFCLCTSPLLSVADWITSLLLPSSHYQRFHDQLSDTQKTDKESSTQRGPSHDVWSRYLSQTHFLISWYHVMFGQAAQGWPRLIVYSCECSAWPSIPSLPRVLGLPKLYVSPLGLSNDCFPPLWFIGSVLVSLPMSLIVSRQIVWCLWPLPGCYCRLLSYLVLWTWKTSWREFAVQFLVINANDPYNLLVFWYSRFFGLYQKRIAKEGSQKFWLLWRKVRASLRTPFIIHDSIVISIWPISWQLDTVGCHI